MAALEGIFMLRFFIGPWSYATGAPGGLFAPMLLLGTSFGALFGEVLNYFLPSLGVTSVACAVRVWRRCLRHVRARRFRVLY